MIKRIILPLLVMTSLSSAVDYKTLKKFYCYYNKNSYKVGGWAVIETAKSVILASKEFGVDSSILAMVVLQESSLRYNVKHKPVTTKVYGKWTRVRAIGLTGVIYEFHKKKLNREGIVKVDLKNIKQNVRACAIILKHYGIRNNKFKALGKYYGKNNKKYAESVLKKVRRLNRL